MGLFVWKAGSKSLSHSELLPHVILLSKSHIGGVVNHLIDAHLAGVPGVSIIKLWGLKGGAEVMVDDKFELQRFNLLHSFMPLIILFFV